MMRAIVALCLFGLAFFIAGNAGGQIIGTAGLVTVRLEGQYIKIGDGGTSFVDNPLLLKPHEARLVSAAMLELAKLPKLLPGAGQGLNQLSTTYKWVEGVRGKTITTTLILSVSPVTADHFEFFFSFVDLSEIRVRNIGRMDERAWAQLADLIRQAADSIR